MDRRDLELSYSVKTREVALEIADGWKYPPPYDFYDMNLTGRGLGLSFMECNLGWLEENLAGREMRLSVACFNDRAMAVYRRSGFRLVRSFEQTTNGAVFDFNEMKYEGR